MKTKITSYILFIAIFFTSCKKDALNEFAGKPNTNDLIFAKARLNSI